LLARDFQHPGLSVRDFQRPGSALLEGRVFVHQGFSFLWYSQVFHDWLRRLRMGMFGV